MENKSLFKKVCADYLNALSLGDLRVYGRYLQITRPTKTCKAELINEIISVLCGEIKPMRNKRGAPVKEIGVRQDVIKDIAKFCECYGVSGVAVSCSAVEKPKEAVAMKEIEKPLTPISSTLNLTIRIELLNERQKELLTELLSGTT